MSGFGVALSALEAGKRVSRAGWNVKGMWLYLTKNWQDNGLNLSHHPPTLPFITMKTVTGDVVPWLASQTDILAKDWDVLP